MADGYNSDSDPCFDDNNEEEDEDELDDNNNVPTGDSTVGTFDGQNNTIDDVTIISNSNVPMMEIQLTILMKVLLSQRMMLS